MLKLHTYTHSTPRLQFRDYSTSTSHKLKVPPIPKSKLEFRFSHSGGAGGQNVNKVNSQAELRLNILDAHWMGQQLKDRFIEVHAHKLTKNGELVIVSQKERRQDANIKDCLQRLKEMMEEASHLPKERVATEKPEWANEKRLDEKKFKSKMNQRRSAGSSGPQW